MVSYGFGVLDFFESFDDDGVCWVGVEDLFFGDFGGNIFKDRCDFVVKLFDFFNEFYGCSSNVFFIWFVIGEDNIDIIINDIVFVGKFLIVYGEECVWSFIYEVEDVDFVFGVFDVVGEWFLVVRDIDELNNGFFCKKDGWSKE